MKPIDYFAALVLAFAITCTIYYLPLWMLVWPVSWYGGYEFCRRMDCYEEQHDGH